MNAVEIEEAVSRLAEKPFDPEEFPFAFLEAFGNKKTTIKRLRAGTTNRSDIGGVLQRNKLTAYGRLGTRRCRFVWWRRRDPGPYSRGIRSSFQERCSGTDVRCLSRLARISDSHLYNLRKEPSSSRQLANRIPRHRPEDDSESRYRLGRA